MPSREEILIRLLQDALSGKRGWRIKARATLGLAGTRECGREGCGKIFTTGGRRKRFCSNKCRDAHYEHKPIRERKEQP